MKKQCFKKGGYDFTKEECQMCVDGADCSRIPECFGNYKEETKFCKDICRFADDCNPERKSEPGNPIEELKICRKKGQISFKEMVQYGMLVIAENAKNLKVDDINPPPAYTPPVYENKNRRRKKPDYNGRMDYIHK